MSRRLPIGVRCGLALFMIGLVAVLLTFTQYFLGDTNRPLAQNLLCMLAPVGMIIAVGSVVRRDRQVRRRAR